MRILAAFLLVLVACGGSNTGDGESSGSDLADPCQLIDQAILDSYFTEPVEAEPGGSGPFLTCTWSDSNANSLLVSVSVSDTVNRPDPCPDCVDLDFGDDGYASSVPLQSSAEFVIGNDWYAVTTTGLGDDARSIADLAREVFQQVGG